MKFDSSAGDNNFERNLSKRASVADERHPVIRAWRFLGLNVGSVLEVGCSSGFLLEAIRREGARSAYGVDVSDKAISYAKENFPDCNFLSSDFGDMQKGFGDRRYDCVILGFYLFVVSPSDWLGHVYKALSLVADNGYIIVTDFSSPFINTRQDYEHQSGVFSCKSSLFRSLEVLPHLVKVFDWQEQVGLFEVSRGNSVPEFHSVTVYKVYSLSEAFVTGRSLA